MNNAAPTTLLLLLALSSGALADQISDQTISTDTVTAIKVTGDSSRLDITAGGDGPHVTTLRGAREAGLLSSWWPQWLKGDCTTTSRMTVDGDTLVVDVASHSGGSRCEVIVTAHVPAGVTLAVDLRAVDARLAGEFGRIDIDGAASDIRLDGHAAVLSVRGGAVQASLAFDHSDNNEQLSLNAPSVNAEFRFPDAVPISYRVDGAVASVVSKRPNTPGALPALSISGAAVNAVIN